MNGKECCRKNWGIRAKVVVCKTHHHVHSHKQHIMTTCMHRHHQSQILGRHHQYKRRVYSTRYLVIFRGQIHFYCISYNSIFAISRNISIAIIHLVACTIQQIIVAIAKIWGPLVDKQSANPFSIALVYNIFASSNNTIISLPSP